MISIQPPGILPSIKNTICTNKNKASAHQILQKAGRQPEIKKKLSPPLQSPNEIPFPQPPHLLSKRQVKTTSHPRAAKPNHHSHNFLRQTHWSKREGCGSFWSVQALALSAHVSLQRDMEMPSTYSLLLSVTQRSLNLMAQSHKALFIVGGIS